MSAEGFGHQRDATPVAEQDQLDKHLEVMLAGIKSTAVIDSDEGVAGLIAGLALAMRCCLNADDVAHVARRIRKLGAASVGRTPT